MAATRPDTAPGDTRPRRARSWSCSPCRLITLLGFAGLALDGGSTFAQQRGQQTAADLAALAAANDYLINGNAIARDDARRDRDRRATGSRTPRAARRSTSRSTRATASRVTVDDQLAPPQRDGRPARACRPGWSRRRRPRSPASRTPPTAPRRSSSPVGAFGSDGTPKYQTPTDFGETNGDVPTSQLDFAWTNYGTGNLDTTEVDRDHQGHAHHRQDARSSASTSASTTTATTTTLYADVNTYLAGRTCRPRSSTRAATSWAGRRST